jgi:hypothetical protein
LTCSIEYSAFHRERERERKNRFYLSHVELLAEVEGKVFAYDVLGLHHEFVDLGCYLRLSAIKIQSTRDKLKRQTNRKLKNNWNANLHLRDELVDWRRNIG